MWAFFFLQHLINSNSCLKMHDGVDSLWGLPCKLKWPTAETTEGS